MGKSLSLLGGVAALAAPGMDDNGPDFAGKAVLRRPLPATIVGA